LATGVDYAALDTLMPHPFYASQYWVSVVNPGEATLDTVRTLLTEAYEFAARKHSRKRSRHERASRAPDRPTGTG
jgi:predicted DNA-binding protein (MmcQ/YjbR family)